MKEMEESKLLDRVQNHIYNITQESFKFKVKLDETCEELSETFNNLNENVKKKKKKRKRTSHFQSEIKHTLSEIKNIQKFSCRSKDPKNQTKYLKYEETKNTQLEKQERKKNKKI